MPAPSPVDLAKGPPVWSVTVGGAALDSAIQLVSVETWAGVNKLPRARVVVSDGSAAGEGFAISETAALIPGVAIEIALGYGASLTTVFSGVIQRQGLELSTHGPSRLVVEATDKALAMTLARGNAVFPDCTDAQVCEKLIGATAGLTAKVTASDVQHPAIVQYYATAWDLLVLRAQAAGMVVTVNAATVTVAPPDTGAAPVLTVTFGQSLLDFRGHIDAATQIAPSAIQSFAWDPGTQALLQSSTASAEVATPGNLAPATLAKVFGVSAFPQQSGGALATDELTAWSSAELMRRKLALLRGEARFQGSALVTPGSTVTLAGLGARFNGATYVSGVHHRYRDGIWVTTVELGLAPGGFGATANVAAPGASGQLPPANNLQVGVVKQINADPAGEYRVLVTLPLLQAAEQAGVWARLGSFYASNGIGANFYPEKDDEVIVAFLNGDPRFPVILGSLYSKAKPPPYPPTDGDSPAPNNIKSFTTKSKLHIDFVEDAKRILIATPDRSITLDDQAGTIVVKDNKNNSITMDASGIAIASGADVTISAKGSVTVTANAKIGLAAKGALEATAAATAKLAADGVTTIKGATVALNP